MSSKSDFDFAKDQPWVSTQRTLKYIDETQELISIYEGGILPEARSKPDESVVDGRQDRPQLSGTNLGALSAEDPPSGPWDVRITEGQQPFGGGVPHTIGAEDSSLYGFNYPTNQYSTPSSGPSTGADQFNASLNSPFPNVDFHGAAGAATHRLGPVVVPSSLATPGLYLDHTLFPLSDKEEARLLRYYVERLAYMFDLTDPLNHFQAVLPHRAATCPTLLNAILAVSARHLSSVSEYDPLVSNRYHQECLKHLIPMLDDTAAILDEDLLAATILLRFVEEIEGEKLHGHEH
ncbi:hypothetical protein M8818_006615 [Zalaria obscura]|uniref:Uncharacterized protein n=1 Tax=Zalaria obscura TaxID=2024903 RepID=A0ACC3S845_9PEZI